MGRRLLDRVRPAETKAPKTVPDPGHDDTVRLRYLATCADMAFTRNVEPAHFDRAIELFPDDAGYRCWRRPPTSPSPGRAPSRRFVRRRFPET